MFAGRIGRALHAKTIGARPLKAQSYRYPALKLSLVGGGAYTGVVIFCCKGFGMIESNTSNKTSSHYAYPIGYDTIDYMMAAREAFIKGTSCVDYCSREEYDGEGYGKLRFPFKFDKLPYEKPSGDLLEDLQLVDGDVFDVVYCGPYRHKLLAVKRILELDDDIEKHQSFYFHDPHNEKVLILEQCQKLYGKSVYCLKRELEDEVDEAITKLVETRNHCKSAPLASELTFNIKEKIELAQKLLRITPTPGRWKPLSNPTPISLLEDGIRLGGAPLRHLLSLGLEGDVNMVLDQTLSDVGAFDSDFSKIRTTTTRNVIQVGGYSVLMMVFC